MATRTTKTELKETSNNTQNMSEDKRKKLEAAISSIEKNHGKNSIQKMGNKAIEPMEFISSGSISLDKALGIGGYPKGRIVETMGAESAGKSTMALHAVAECQKAGGVAGYVDVEHALDLKYAKNLGVDTNNLYVSQPENAESALDITDELVCSGAFDIVVVDSTNALVPKAELEGAAGDAQMGLQARLMSQACRKLVGSVARTKCLLIFISQSRSKIGVFFGSPTVYGVGNALKFYASVRMEVTKIATNKAGDESVSNSTKVKIIKNKVAPPFKEAIFDIEFGKGIDVLTEIINYSITMGMIEKAGSWYSYGEDRIGQGVASVKKFLIENPDITESLRSRILGSEEEVEIEDLMLSEEE